MTVVSINDGNSIYKASNIAWSNYRCCKPWQINTGMRISLIGITICPYANAVLTIYREGKRLDAKQTVHNTKCMFLHSKPLHHFSLKILFFGQSFAGRLEDFLKNKTSLENDGFILLVLKKKKHKKTSPQ